MYQQELFLQILSATSEITGISPQRIISPSRDRESTDARYIVATLLSEHGYYTGQIAQYLRRTPRSIRWLHARTTDKMLLIHLNKVRDMTRTPT